MTFVALNSGRQKSTMIFLIIVKLPTWVIHGVVKILFILSFEIILTDNMVEIHPLSNKTRKVFKP